jgi:hypothetical protein
MNAKIRPMKHEQALIDRRPYFLPNGDKTTRVYCHHCQRKEATPYYDSKTNTPINEAKFYKCNHSISCSYDLRPNKRINSRHNNRYVKQTNYKSRLARKKQITFIKREDIKKICSLDHTLFRWLLDRFGEKRMMEVSARMLMCGLFINDENWTVFLQYDLNGNCRTGKCIQFDFHDSQPRKKKVHFLHSVTSVVSSPLDNIEQTYFGLNQLTQNLDDLPIAIVESEKTAVIMTLYRPSLIWIATGGKSNLCSEKLKPFKSRKIILIPDIDAIDDWTNKSNELNGLGFSTIVYSSWIEYANSNVYSPTMDILDVALQYEPDKTPSGFL